MWCVCCPPPPPPHLTHPRQGPLLAELPGVLVVLQSQHRVRAVVEAALGFIMNLATHRDHLVPLRKLHVVSWVHRALQEHRRSEEVAVRGLSTLAFLCAHPGNLVRAGPSPACTCTVHVPSAMSVFPLQDRDCSHPPPPPSPPTHTMCEWPPTSSTWPLLLLRSPCLLVPTLHASRCLGGCMPCHAYSHLSVVFGHVVAPPPPDTHTLSL